jgi:diaminohydroxyphosphoribosylaminopyrimidine deaminase / 5-amino-6-(5-phosphoribosylamino)uracil reductase
VNPAPRPPAQLVEADRASLARALEEARRGVGHTSPNPPVGAVLARGDGTIIATGYHTRAGAPHAEAECLAAAGPGPYPDDATLYITLEPCAHWGRTPPCSHAIVAAGIRRVVVGVRDVNPLVAGGGLAHLREHGVTVIEAAHDPAGAEWAAACAELVAPFFHFITTKRPWVTLKAAVTLDGYLGAATGTERRITGDEARTAVHGLRFEHDAIITGIGTVLADDPQLTVRFAAHKRLHRVVLDSQLRLTPGFAVTDTAGAPTTVFTTRPDALTCDAGRALLDKGVAIVVLPQAPGRVPLAAVLDHLGAAGHMAVLVEAGGQVNHAFFDAGLVQRLVLFVAPRLLGGTGGTPLLAGPGRATLAETINGRFAAATPAGDDLCLNVRFP